MKIHYIKSSTSQDFSRLCRSFPHCVKLLWPALQPSSRHPPLERLLPAVARELRLRCILEHVCLNLKISQTCSFFIIFYSIIFCKHFRPQPPSQIFSHCIILVLVAHSAQILLCKSQTAIHPPLCSFADS